MPCLFLNIAQLTSKRLHKVQVENSLSGFHEIRWRLQHYLWWKRGDKVFEPLDWRIFWLHETIRMKIHSTEVCSKTLQIFGKWETANCDQLCKGRSIPVFNLDYSVLEKRLLDKARNSFLPTMYNAFKCKSLFLRLPKVAFFTKQKSQTVLRKSIHSTFERRFRISLKAVTL